jgi:sugar phosphate isomerase/epimerase
MAEFNPVHPKGAEIMAYPPLAAQLIVFDRHYSFDANAEVVLDTVKSTGFGAIEGGVNLYAHAPRACKAMLDARNLKVAGLHGSVTTQLDDIFRLMEVYDTRDLCVSNVGGWQGRSADKYLVDIEALNQMGRTCHAHGCHVHYHNHAYEFAPTDRGLSGMELILGNIDAAVADLCVDVAWVHVGGEDPAIFLRRCGALVGYVHLKDYIGDRHWVELGQGVMRLDNVMKALATLPSVRWVAYEQDTTDRTPAESCAISHHYLESTFGYK